VSVIDTATHAVVGTFTLGSGATGIAITPDGSRLYVTDVLASPGPGNVVVIDTSSNAIVTTLSIGTGPPSALGQFIGGPPAPTALKINAGGIVNSASYAPNMPVAPGSIASVFGTFPVSTTLPTTIPLPTVLSGLSLELEVPFAPFRIFQAPLFFVSSTQVNIQIPWELSGQTSAYLAGTIGPQMSSIVANLATFAPGIFTMNSEGQGAIIDALSGQLIGPSNPAIPGVTYISIYCTGLGPVTNQPATGAAASSTVLSETTARPTVMIGGVPANILFSGLAPRLVGLYQINVQVPAGVPSGDSIPVILSIGGATANSVAIAIKPAS
jgi:uncharacterized protein (TIGR03437 family)